MNESVGEMRAAIKEMAQAMTKMAELENNQGHARRDLERTEKVIENLSDACKRWN